MSKHLSPDEFLTRLTTLFTSRASAASGSIYLVQKRFPDEHADASAKSGVDDLADLNAPPGPVLIRATDGKSRSTRTGVSRNGTKVQKKDRVKMSCVVQPDDLDGFFEKYADVCKQGMGGLKKRDRKGRKKAKGKGKQATT